MPGKYQDSFWQDDGFSIITNGNGAPNTFIMGNSVILNTYPTR